MSARPFCSSAGDPGAAGADVEGTVVGAGATDGAVAGAADAAAAVGAAEGLLADGAAQRAAQKASRTAGTARAIGAARCTSLPILPILPILRIMIGEVYSKRSISPGATVSLGGARADGQNRHVQSDLGYAGTRVERRPCLAGKRWRRALAWFPFTALAAENLALFFNHYFRGWGFPWDFLGPYYAMVAYWTSGVHWTGAVPQWVPYQSMGYPFAINLQSGVCYPPFWLFPLFHASYSLHRAVVLQCLHVLAGALGAYLLARRLGLARRDAFLAAFAFQLFGGFYSNAEHPDIVRGFALAPWLLWSLTRPRAPARKPRAFPAATPLVVYLIAAGGYAGILLAGLLLGAVWVVLQAAEQFRTGGARKPALKFVAGSALAVALGLAMSVLPLGPAWIFRGELARYHEHSGFEAVSLGLRQLPGLFLPNGSLPGNAAMSSTFLPFAILLPVLWAPWRRAGVLAVWAFTAVALAMAAGPGSPVYRLARALAPPLGYSRLPAADYRGFFALGLCLLGAFGLARLRRARPGPWIWLRLALFATVVAWGVSSAQRNGLEATAAITATGFALATALVYSFGGRARVFRGTFLAGALALLMAADAGRVLWRMKHLDLDLWRVPDVAGLCHRRFPAAFPEGFDGTVPRRLFEPRSGPRGPRQDFAPGEYKGDGYLAGILLINDHSGAVLAARRRVEENPNLLAYMVKGWEPTLLPPDARSIQATEPIPAGAVRQIAYGNERIDYDVDLDRPALLVENEVSFAGWEASVGEAGRRERIRAVAVDGALRGWRLPRGKYRMTARFEFPGWRLLRLVSEGAALVWIVSVFLLRRRSKPGAKLPAPS